MNLKPEIIEKIRTDSNLRAKLMLAGDKSEYSIKRYIEDPANEELTKAKYTKVIAEHTGINESDLFTLETVPA